MFVDSHCHLNYPGLVEGQPDVLARARRAGVAAMLNIATRESEWDAVLGTAERETDVWATVGVHPHEADAHAHVTADALIARAANPRIAGLGETGLDFHYDRSDRGKQELLFRRHIEAARATGLPIVIHTRDAEDATVRVLEGEMARGPFTGVLHCFTGTAALAQAGLRLGLFVSISGIVTFKTAHALQDVARTIPLDRLLIETDAPFLAPVPHRGKTAEPAFVVDTARFLADLRGEPLETLAAETSANFRRLFLRAA